MIVLRFNIQMGASTVKYMEKHQNVVAKCCLNWNFFHGTLYCHVRYSFTKYEDDIF
jgi:hypothetical protein